MIKKLLRAGAYGAGFLALLVAGAYAYVLSLDLDSIPKADPNATVADVAWLQQERPAPRGKILAVVSSTELMPDGKKKTGYELTELARAYYVFEANGYQVDIASPKGGKPRGVLDKDDMAEADYAFLNDPVAKARRDNSLALATVDPAQYAAVYFVGGKGAMFDFAGNPDIARILSDIAPRGVVGAVCHGPAALMKVKLADGSALLAGKRMTGFTNDEELFLMSDARKVFPFLLEDQARQEGAHFVAGTTYLKNTIVDGRLVTGQNPWSAWSVAEQMVRQLGYEPVPRPLTAEENSVRLLTTYHRHGLDAARAEQARLVEFDKMLLLMHAVVAGMQWRALDAFQLQRLANG